MLPQNTNKDKPNKNNNSNNKLNISLNLPPKSNNPKQFKKQQSIQNNNNQQNYLNQSNKSYQSGQSKESTSRYPQNLMINFQQQQQQSHRQELKKSQNKNDLFLQQENKRLKQEIQDLREVIAMNKVQIDILSRLSQNQNQNHYQSNHHNPKQKIQHIPPPSLTQHDKKLLDLVYKYRLTYQDLRKKVSQLRNLIQQKAEQNLLLEQVNQQTLVQNKAVQEFYQQNIQNLKNNITLLENKLFQNQRQRKEYDGMTGFVLKNRDIFTPTEQAIEFRNHQIQWGQQINLMKDRIGQSKKTEQNLIIANTLLRNKVVSLQAKLAMPNRNLGQILDKSLKRLMVYFIQTQKKILAGDDSDSSDQQDLELIAPQIHGLFPQKQLKKIKQNGVHIPHLDLLKVRQSMINGNQKIQEQLRRRNHLTKDQRIQRLQIQLQYTRRQLSKNIIQLRDQKDRRKKFQKMIDELTYRNQQLISSNQEYQKKLKKCLKEIQSNKQKVLAFIKNMNQQQQERSYQKSTNYNHNQNNQNYSNTQDTSITHNKNSYNVNMLNQLSFIHRDFNLDSSFNNINLGMGKNINNNPKGKKNQKIETINNKKETPYYLLNDPKLQFKIHMEILQKQLEQNQKLSKIRQGQKYNLKRINKLQQQQQDQDQDDINLKQKYGKSKQDHDAGRRIKRSTSNPFLYFNERRQEILQVKNQCKNQKDLEDGFRLQQTQYPVPKIMEGWTRGAQQDLDDVQI